jgi:hypothetical protein
MLTEQGEANRRRAAAPSRPRSRNHGVEEVRVALNPKLLSIVVLSSVVACRAPTNRLQGLQAVAKMGTLEVHYSKILWSEKGATKRFLFFTTGKSKAWHVAKSDAVLTLGVDLKKLGPDDVTVAGERVSLVLPPIEIIDFDYDPTHYQVDEQLSGFEGHHLSAKETGYSVTEIDESYRRGEEHLRKQLPYKTLQEMAERRTAEVFRLHLRNEGFTEVFVTFKKGDLVGFEKGDPR